MHFFCAIATNKEHFAIELKSQLLVIQDNLIVLRYAQISYFLLLMGLSMISQKTVPNVAGLDTVTDHSCLREC